MRLLRKQKQKGWSSTNGFYTLCLKRATGKQQLFMRHQAVSFANGFSVALIEIKISLPVR